MKLILAALTVLGITLTASPSFAEYCGSTVQMDAPLVNTAVHNLYMALPSLRNSISDLQSKNPNLYVCTSAVIVDQDGLGYGLYYVKINAYRSQADYSTGADALAHFRFLDQDSSVQGTDGPNSSFWADLGYPQTQQIENKVLQEDYVQAPSVHDIGAYTTSDSILSLAERTSTFASFPVEMATLSYIQLDKNTYLVTWRGQAQTTNLSEIRRFLGAIIRLNPAEMQAIAAENFYLSDLEQPLQKEFNRTFKLGTAPNANLDLLLRQFSGMQ